VVEHAGCILAIVGSREVPLTPAMRLVAKVLAEHKPIMVISGGAKVTTGNRLRQLGSIDQIAAELARTDNITVVEFLPTNYHWSGAGGFAERNMKIAQSCVCLVRIASETTTTYGSGWTADRAEDLGKEVTRYTIKSNGTVVDGQIGKAIT